MAALNSMLLLSSVPRSNPSFSYGLRPPLLKVAKPQYAVRQFAHTCLQMCAAAPRHDRQEFNSSAYQFDDDPLWLVVLEDLVGGLRSLVAFLAEQPRQLKHLEWPGFQNTLRTAILTLILVAMFIVALSSVDATLCYILALLLRKSA